MRFFEFATHNLLKLQEAMLQQAMPVPYLYHATREENLVSIRRDGILTRFYGVVHGRMDIHPPKPAIYLSRKPKSDNLHSDLFNTPVVVLKIDATKLDQNEIYPDDFLYDMVIDGEVFVTAKSISKALGCSIEQAKVIFSQIENTDEKNLPLILKPFWRWYLKWPKGGEIAYTANIPAKLIVDVKPY